MSLHLFNLNRYEHICIRKGQLYEFGTIRCPFQRGNPAIPIEKCAWAEMLLKQNCELGH
jgi:hypothetical protein